MIIQRITFTELENNVIVFQLITSELIDLCITVLIAIIYTFIGIVIEPWFVCLIAWFHMCCCIRKSNGLIVRSKLIMTIIIVIVFAAV